jgi:ABC-type Na+ efflux pump permease subunit
MRRILLVAQREYLQIARTKSFWLTLLLMPALFLIMPLIAGLASPSDTSRFLIVDPSGRHAAAIEQRLALSHQRQVLYALAEYATRWDLRARSPDAIWDDGARPFSDEEVRAFVASGGVGKALKEAGSLGPDIPTFTPPLRAIFAAPLPADIPADRGAEAFGAAAAPYLAAGSVSAAIYVPADFGPQGPPTRIWTGPGGADELVELVRRELNSAVRIDAARNAGLDDGAARRILATAAPVTVSAPPRGQGRERMMLQSALPLGIAYFLLMSIFVSGAWLLQGVIEERSNKLLEAVLACISPTELMYGKLVGIVGVGMTVVVVWASCLVGGAFLAPGDIARLLGPAIASIQSPWLAVALIFYFITGYLISAMIFLAIGSISDSMSDAQAYLTPVMMVQTLPFIVLGQLISNPDATSAKVMSWIPIYTPIAMLARMGGGVETYEVVGTSILLVAFIALELFLLGRVFQASLLRTGQPPRIGEFVRLMFRRAR